MYMTQAKKRCEDVHTCRRCKKKCLCQTYAWACPWRNDDEDQMCDPCMEIVAKEVEEFWKDMGDG